MESFVTENGKGFETQVGRRQSKHNKWTDYTMSVFESSEIQCFDIARLLGEYVENDLPESLHARFDVHFASCPTCSRLREEYLLVISSAKKLKDKPLPNGVEERLKEALSKKLGISL